MPRCPTRYRCSGDSMPAHFLAFLGGSALINLVTTALSVAVGWHIYEHSGNPMDLAIVGLMQIIPTFLFFFASGWIVDSFSRKHLLILCAIAESLVMAGLALVMLAGELILPLYSACCSAMAASAPSISRQRRRLSRIWFPRHNCRAPLRLVRRSAMSP